METTVYGVQGRSIDRYLAPIQKNEALPHFILPSLYMLSFKMTNSHLTKAVQTFIRGSEQRPSFLRIKTEPHIVRATAFRRDQQEAEG